MADRHRSREPRESGERRHKKRHSTQNGGPSDRRRSSRPAAPLSMDALAALNDANVRSPRSGNDEEEELERQRRHERRERRRRESRAKVDRDEYREVARDSPPRAHRKRESRTYASAPTTPSYDDVAGDSDYRRERRHRRSAATPSYEDVAADSDYQRERRPRRKDRDRSSRAPAYESAPVEEVPEVFQDMMAENADRERRRRERKRKPKTVMASSAGAGAAAATSKGFWHNLRGGRGKAVNTSASTSYDSFYKEEGYREDPPKKRFWTKRKKWVAAALSLVILILIIVAAVLATKNGGLGGSNCTNHLTCNLNSIESTSIPSDAPSYLNPFTWYDTMDFNLTYTDVVVGDLPIMGLNSTWDDSAAANDLVPALNEDWGSYSSRPARGVNLGGWLSLEPFIAPELFAYDASLGIIDEYTLCTYLGPAQCAATLEKHYSSFITESTFAEIADAGLDHIRIPYSYWAVQTYDDDPYLFRTSWRYLLRGIEYARKYGLRVNLDLHALPGSQNGWNHSGRQGAIGWFNGTNSTQNVARSIDVHDRLTQFFAQPRYANVISHYGLANEPRMTFIAPTEVLNWTSTVYALARSNGLPNRTVIVMGDGFRGLDAWQGELSGYGDGLALDVHQYVIFNNEQIVYNHTEKVAYACDGWTQQTTQSMDTSTGFGPTMVAEWSQADTDCAKYLTNVGWGNRWTGTYDTGNATDPLRALTPMCPLEDDSCSCTAANADPSVYSDEYKEFLLYFASAQMDSFETGWGWWYWTWWTGEGSAQWSYKRGLAAGILPAKAYDRSFSCGSTEIPNWSPALPETY